MISDWQNECKSIAEAFFCMYNKGLYTDCSFVVGQGTDLKIFSAHKYVLVGVSPVFEKMLFGNLGENVSQIEITDTDPSIFEKFLSIIYTERVQLKSFSEACDLFYLASKYLVQKVIDPTLAFILGNIKPSTAIEAYEILTLFGQEEAAADCKKVILHQTSAVINSESFLKIEKQSLLMILKEDWLQVNSEFELYDAASRWMNAEIERKGIIDASEKEALESEIFSSIRFLSMSAEEFLKGPAYCSFFSRDEALSIITNIVHPGTTYATLPEKMTLGMRCSFQLLEEVVKKGNTKELARLWNLGADIKIRDKHGLSLLHHAVKNGHLGTMKWLIQQQLDVNSTDNTGSTPLHFAATANNIVLVKTLLHNGADPIKRNLKGKLPIDLASRESLIDYLDDF